MNPELLQALVMNGSMGIRTASVFKKCCKETFDLLTESMMNSVIIPQTVEEDCPDVLWFARFIDEGTDIDMLRALRDRLQFGDIDLVSQLLYGEKINQLFFDTRIQEKFMRICLNFDTYDNPRRIHMMVTRIYMSYCDKCNDWRSKKLQYTDVITGFVFILQVLISTIEWAIKHWAVAKDLRNMLPAMFSGDFLRTISSKIQESMRSEYFTDIIHKPTTDRQVAHVFIALTLADKVICDWCVDIYTSEIYRTKRSLKSWKCMLDNVYDMHIGARGGVYSVTKNGKKRYW